MGKRSHPAPNPVHVVENARRDSEPRYGSSFSVDIEQIGFSVLFTNLVSPLHIKLQIPSRAGIAT